MKTNDFKRVNTRYSISKVKEIVWKLRDVEDVPEGFSREAIIGNPEDFVSMFRWLFKDEIKEKFVVAILNTSNHVQAIEIVTQGTLNSSLVHPREVFRPAIVFSAASIIVCHNHPSGNPEPSQEDIAITKQLQEASRIIGIPLFDHIIFAGDSFTSFASRGLL